LLGHSFHSYLHTELIQGILFSLITPKNDLLISFLPLLLLVRIASSSSVLPRQ